MLVGETRGRGGALRGGGSVAGSEGGESGAFGGDVGEVEDHVGGEASLDAETVVLGVGVAELRELGGDAAEIPETAEAADLAGEFALDEGGTGEEV